MARRLLVWFCLALGLGLGAAEVTVMVDRVQQRWPWNGKVDIDYTITYDDAEADIYVSFIGKDGGANRSFPLKTLAGAGANGVVKAGRHRITWDMSVDEPTLHTGDFTVSVQAFTGAWPYLVVDLSGGTDVSRYPVRYSALGPDVSQDTCRTTELWLRLVPPGTFMMGSPDEELGRLPDETLHQVTLTRPFYIGVFEVTQKQYALVMGSNPSNSKGDTRPVEQVSYDTLRGAVSGASWPQSHQVDEGTFFHVLRAKTALLFDLPTEAQWEYACRAGTSTALNSGKNLTNIQTCPNMDEVGRYRGNGSDHVKVGNYLPNAWGLYDMHGNVAEWCLDGYGKLSADAVTDPTGIKSNRRVQRGSNHHFGPIYDNGYSYYSPAAINCRSAYRGGASVQSTVYSRLLGFRLVCLPAE